MQVNGRTIEFELEDDGEFVTLRDKTNGWYILTLGPRQGGKIDIYRHECVDMSDLYHLDPNQRVIDSTETVDEENNDGIL